MQIKTTLAVIALSLAPTLALAQGCIHGTPSKVTASSCVEGMVFDAEKQACVPLTSS